MASNLKSKIATAEKRRNKARDAVYASEATGRVPFSGCLALASDKVRSEYEAAMDRLHKLRLEAVTAGKAHFGAFDRLCWY